MTTQPEALRLADQLDIFNANCPVVHGFENDDAKAAAELRRQHARIAELEAALRFYAESCDATETTDCGYFGNMCCKVARAALKAAHEA